MLHYPGAGVLVMTIKNVSWKPLRLNTGSIYYRLNSVSPLVIGVMGSN